MLGNEYQKLATRTNDGLSTERLADYNPDEYFDVGGTINACLGLAGEAGELNDMVKKSIFHEKKMDFEHLKKELGDVMWYVALFCESMRWNLDEILQMNVDKLKARYPDGFDVEKANNRREGDV